MQPRHQKKMLELYHRTSTIWKKKMECLLWVKGFYFSLVITGLSFMARKNDSTGFIRWYQHLHFSLQDACFNLCSCPALSEIGRTPQKIVHLFEQSLHKVSRFSYLTVFHTKINLSHTLPGETLSCLCKSLVGVSPVCSREAACSSLSRTLDVGLWSLCTGSAEM